MALQTLTGRKVFFRNGSKYFFCFYRNIQNIQASSDDLHKRLRELNIPKKAVDSITANSSLSSLNENNVCSSIETLSKCQFGNTLLNTLLAKHPLLLMAEAKKLDKTCKNLFSIFSKKYVYDILLNSPQVLNEDWDVTCEKLKYLQEEMVLSNLDIVKHGILEHSLDYIRKRHEFIERTGKYKKLKPKIPTKDRNIINPTVDIIFNSSPAIFVTKVAGVTLLEYEFFEDLETICGSNL